ncbi:hypothetical protein DSO57_1015994 [Entomophthora muscae]|uniref:Uncharacterized protein n=1 Tax=Entomophthora muscae TaxID=34485 RepID=A0ACC2STQ9_9FUNG|nr:hypothetical protein DSO57_1015994 [Entomophthora muscae]
MCESITDNFFKNNIGVEVFYKVWQPKAAPKAHVVFCHGHGEHVSRYDQIFAKFAESNIKVLAFDQVGCGETGKRVNDIGGAMGEEQVLRDMTFAIDLIHNPNVPLFLMGHSFGGLSAMNYASRGEKRHLVHGAIASAPCVELAKERLPPTFIINVLMGISYIAPSLKLPIGVENNVLCRNKTVVESYCKDPLVFYNSALLQFRGLVFGGQKLVTNGYKDIKVDNLLITHGTDDVITAYEASYALAKKLKQEKKIPNLKLKTYYGYRHELMFEPEANEVIQNYIDWILNHLKKSDQFITLE